MLRNDLGDGVLLEAQTVIDSFNKVKNTEAGTYKE